MKLLAFLLTLFFVFFLISSLSYQYKPRIRPKSEKIHPELLWFESLNSQEKVKVIVWLKGKKSIKSFKNIGEVHREDMSLEMLAR